MRTFLRVRNIHTDTFKSSHLFFFRIFLLRYTVTKRFHEVLKGIEYKFNIEM